MNTSMHQELLSELLRHEQELQFTTFSNEMALNIGLALIDAVKAMGQAAAISIVRNGQQIFQHTMSGCTPDNSEWIRRKENVVQRFGHSSYYVGTLYRSQGTTFEAIEWLDSSIYAAHGGCFPIILKGAGPIGTVTVSGMPQADDHAVVVKVLAEFVDASRA